ncbi:MAG: hypothetical protein Q4G52_12020, partial [Clostridia bacterium]|nr:hypothetical protein [Clostridia bacterium]
FSLNFSLNFDMDDDADCDADWSADVVFAPQKGIAMALLYPERPQKGRKSGWPDRFSFSFFPFAHSS